MGVLSGIKDFSFGTAKGAVSNGWQGLKFSGMLSAAVAGIGTVAAISFLAPVSPFLAAGGVIGSLALGVGTFSATAVTTTSIGAAWGSLFGGTKELNKSAKSKEQDLEVGRANVEYQIEAAKSENTSLKQGMSAKYAGGNRAPASNQQGQGQASGGYTRYQMHNHLAEGNAPNKFTNQFEAQKANAHQNVGAGRGGK